MSSLISLFQRRRAPFEALLAPHIEGLYRFAYRLRGDRDAAEELVQELLTRLYPRRDELAGIEQLRPWLKRSLYNLFIDQTRSEARRPSIDAEADVQLQVDDQVHEGERELQRRQIDQALQQLSPEHRGVLVLHDMEGYTLSELAEMLDTPLGTLKSRLHRARRQARERLAAMQPFSTDRRS